MLLTTGIFLSRSHVSLPKRNKGPSFLASSRFIAKKNLFLYWHRTVILGRSFHLLMARLKSIREAGILCC